MVYTEQEMTTMKSYVLSKIEYGGNEFGSPTIMGLTLAQILFDDAHLSGLGKDGTQRILNELEVSGAIYAELKPGRGEVYNIRRR